MTLTDSAFTKSFSEMSVCGPAVHLFQSVKNC